MTVQRKPLVKAPAIDVVAALTTAPSPATEEPAAETHSVSTEENKTVASEPSSIVSRRGPGRPRSKRRMEPFSSKIEINLRDALDGYLAENDITIIDFLDEAIRDRLAK